MDGLIEERHNILGVDFDLIDYESAFRTIESWRNRNKSEYISITNPHSALMCHRDEQMNRATAGAAMTLPDGVGIIIAANLLGYKNCGRLTGPTFMLKLCDWGREKGYRHFFYGGKEGIADRLAERLSDIYPGLQVAGTYCPPFRELSEEEDRKIVEIINASKPDIVWVCLGAPKQEKWIANHVGYIKTTVMLGVGAAFDFHSGNVKWAPDWLRRLGLEWAYRLAKEPRRMWRRNLNSPIFLVKVLWQRIQMCFNKQSKTQHFAEKQRTLNTVQKSLDYKNY